MRRRALLKMLGGSAVALPCAAYGQKPDGTRRIGIMVSTGEDDREGQARVAAFTRQLDALGWRIGSNLQIDLRWGASDLDRAHVLASELLRQAPDLLIANASPAAVAASRLTRSLPILFVQVTDPVAYGLVASMAKPGGNLTGFTSFEDTMGGKWPQLLKKLVGDLERVVVLRGHDAGVQLLPAVDASARSLGLDLTVVDVRDGAGIEAAFAAESGRSRFGVITVPDPIFTINRSRLIALAAEHRVPATYYFRFFAEDGGLVAYGPDTIAVYRQTASYADQILRGAKPADLPVQNPTSFELVLNLRTARSLGLSVPSDLLAAADAVIE